MKLSLFGRRGSLSRYLPGEKADGKREVVCVCVCERERERE